MIVSDRLGSFAVLWPNWFCWLVVSPARLSLPSTR